eukprot:1159241-Pelagomonas_calceolata.AAC.10
MSPLGNMMPGFHALQCCPACLAPENAKEVLCWPFGPAQSTFMQPGNLDHLRANKFRQRPKQTWQPWGTGGGGDGERSRGGDPAP